jgi:hypothetical protein
MSCECPRCRVFARVLRTREDPAAPLPFEVWLAHHPEDWPWWVLGGVVGMIGLLLLSAVGAVFVLLGAGIAAIPSLRRQLDDCERVPS